MADEIKPVKIKAEKSVRIAKAAAPAGGPTLPVLDVVAEPEPQVVVQAAAEALPPTVVPLESVSVPIEAAESAEKIFPSFEIMMKGLAKMTDTSAFSTDKAQAVFGQFNERAKTAAEKGSKFVEELSELTKGNIEAIVASGKIAAKGAESLGADAAAYGKASFEKTTGVFKSMTTVKSPAELLQIQSEFAKSSFDSMIAESSKLTESYVKLASDMFQPLSSRFALAAEKIKSAAL